MTKVFYDVILAEDENGASVPLEKRPLRMALATGATTNTTTDPTYYYVRKDKTKFPVAIMVTPVILKGKVIGTIEVFRDITKEKGIDRAKSEFVSLASHQLRTPLSSIRWYSEMLLSGDAGKLEDKQQTYVEEINHGNLRMIELVNALLNVSRFEMGALEVKEEDVDVGKVIRDVMHDTESRAKKQGVHVSVKIPDDLPHAVIDQKLVRMLIENLIVNAIKYTPQKGTVLVEIIDVKKGDIFEGHRADSRSLGLSVVDTGIGIPEGQKERLFSKLFRADNARAIDADGTGLGLYLVKRVAEYCKGEVWFVSIEGNGSTFFALLPLFQSRDSMLGDTISSRTVVDDQVEKIIKSLIRTQHI